MAVTKSDSTRIRGLYTLLKLITHWNVMFRDMSYLLFGKAWVNDIHDTIDSQRGLSNIRWDYNFPPNGTVGFVCWCSVKNFLLLAMTNTRTYSTILMLDIQTYLGGRVEYKGTTNTVPASGTLATSCLILRHASSISCTSHSFNIYCSLQTDEPLAQ